MASMPSGSVGPLSSTSSGAFTAFVKSPTLSSPLDPQGLKQPQASGRRGDTIRSPLSGAESGFASSTKQSLLRESPLRSVQSASSPANHGEKRQVQQQQQRQQQQRQQQQQKKSEADKTDALWAEMQTTLTEVELSATSGTRFFGAGHSEALEELRKSQLALAQSWARSEAEEISEHSGHVDSSTEQSPGTSLHGDNFGKDMEMESSTEKDILLARKRREANDNYFSRVSKGVQDVVARLEEVATAMGKVERESRDAWSKSETVDSESSAA